ncbi:(R)-stereoselective amidase [subsurface metagenome]
MAINVAVAQMNSIPGDVETNLKKVEALLRSAALLQAELVLVPETFSTGYDVGSVLDRVAEPIPGRTTDFLAKLAAELKIYFYGSFIEKNGNKYNNTAVLISPGGEIIGRYRKVHLFSTEKERFEPGNQALVVNTPLGKFGLTICMDLLFPEYIRGLVLAGAEYILNTTDWLRWGPLDEWEWHYKQPRALAAIRALENTVCLAMACQWGKEGEFSKFGHSCIVSPSGRVLAGIEEGEGVVVQKLTIERVEEWRKIATYLDDRKDHLDLYRKQLDF